MDLVRLPEELKIVKEERSQRNIERRSKTQQFVQTPQSDCVLRSVGGDFLEKKMAANYRLVKAGSQAPQVRLSKGHNFMSMPFHTVFQGSLFERQLIFPSSPDRFAR